MKKSKSDQIVHDAFRELHMKEPDRARLTRLYKGEEAAKKQVQAIALDLARSRGAKV